jgi:hypothetical protein
MWNLRLTNFVDYIPTTTEGFVVQNGKTLYKGNVSGFSTAYRYDSSLIM